jgi:hypothetical protein
VKGKKKAVGIMDYLSRKLMGDRGKFDVQAVELGEARAPRHGRGVESFRLS